MGRRIESYGRACPKCKTLVKTDFDREETLTEIAQNLHGTYTGSAEIYYEEEGKRQFEADKAELKNRLDNWEPASSKNEKMKLVDDTAKAYFQAIYDEVKDLTW